MTPPIPLLYSTNRRCQRASTPPGAVFFGKQTQPRRLSPELPLFCGQLKYWCLSLDCAALRCYTTLVNTKTTLAARKRAEQKHKVAVRRSTAGLGLYTTIPRKKDDLLVEYTGERISEDEADRRGGKYLFTLGEGRVLDGKDRKHLGRYANHSCAPNCYAELDEEPGRVYLRAKRALAAGEELTYHYGRTYFDDYIKPYGCRCTKCTAA